MITSLSVAKTLECECRPSCVLTVEQHPLVPLAASLSLTPDSGARLELVLCEIQRVYIKSFWKKWDFVCRIDRDIPRGAFESVSVLSYVFCGQFYIRRRSTRCILNISAQYRAACHSVSWSGWHTVLWLEADYRFGSVLVERGMPITHAYAVFLWVELASSLVWVKVSGDGCWRRLEVVMQGDALVSAYSAQALCMW